MRRDAPRLRRLELPAPAKPRILVGGPRKVRHGLVYRANRSDERSRFGTEESAREAARPGGPGRPGKPGRADPDRRYPDGGELPRCSPPGHVPGRDDAERRRVDPRAQRCGEGARVGRTRHRRVTTVSYG